MKFGNIKARLSEPQMRVILVLVALLLFVIGLIDILNGILDISSTQGENQGDIIELIGRIQNNQDKFVLIDQAFLSRIRNIENRLETIDSIFLSRSEGVNRETFAEVPSFKKSLDSIRSVVSSLEKEQIRIGAVGDVSGSQVSHLATSLRELRENDRAWIIHEFDYIFSILNGAIFVIVGALLTVAVRLFYSRRAGSPNKSD